MDPVTMAVIAALMGGGSQFLEVAPTLFRTEEDKENAKQLDKLKKEQENHQFGLNNAQKSVLTDSYVQPGLRALQAVPTSGVTNNSIGSDVAQNIAMNTQRGASLGDLQGQAAGMVLAADQTKRQQQRQELEDRIAYQSQRRQEQLAAGLSILSSGLLAGGSSGQQSKLTGSPPAPSSAPLTAPPSTPGVPTYTTPPVAPGLPGIPSSVSSGIPSTLAMTAASNPEFSTMLTSLLGLV